jgi:hypothetical protein
LIAAGFKVGCVLLALVVGSELLARVCSNLSALQALIAVCFLVLVSPAAYVLLRDRQGGVVRHERRGAERTPVLPALEDDHE